MTSKWRPGSVDDPEPEGSGSLECEVDGEPLDAGSDGLAFTSVPGALPVLGLAPVWNRPGNNS